MPFPRRLQDLPPRWARLALRVERLLRETLAPEPPSGPWLIACSGGSDSTALLLLARLLAPRFHTEIAAAHLDHSLRPESAEDAAHVRELCASLDIPLHLRRADVADHARELGLGIEEAGRDCRLEWFAELAVEHGYGLILLGHQADDLAEDALMRLVRGAGWPELAGMPLYDPERKLMRPLLYESRQDLRELLAELSIPWREDPSNAEPLGLRNRVRLELLPLIRRENPAFTRAAVRLHRLGRIDQDHWDDLLAGRLLDDRLLNGPDGVRIPAEGLAGLDRAGRLRLFKAALARLGHTQPYLATLLRLDAAWQERHTGAVIQFPGDKRAAILREGVLFYHEQAP